VGSSDVSEEVAKQEGYNLSLSVLNDWMVRLKANLDIIVAEPLRPSYHPLLAVVC
jgi:hypothetical protein